MLKPPPAALDHHAVTAKATPWGLGAVVHAGLAAALEKQLHHSPFPSLYSEQKNPYKTLGFRADINNLVVFMLKECFASSTLLTRSTR